MRLFGQRRSGSAGGEQQQQHNQQREVGLEDGSAVEDRGGEMGAGSLDWKPTTHQLLIMVTLSIISFMVSLDACIIVTSLSVSLPRECYAYLGTCLTNRHRTS